MPSPETPPPDPFKIDIDGELKASNAKYVTEPLFTEADVEMLEYVGQYGFPAVKNAYPTVEQWQSLIDRIRTQIRP